jgi:two-component system cell cycle response regulator DivK
MSKLILVAEDQDMNRLLIRDLLLYNGYEVIEAENGKTAVELAQQRQPDLILMDIQMPVMDGFTALIKVRQDKTISSIKVIALTSFAMKGDRAKIMEAGFNDYLAKPIDTRAFNDFIRKSMIN